jgi:tRNA-Thr(GGU) m(6)t(6)A37 methyltransferase TsaA
MKTVEYTPIGTVHSPFKHPEETPIQPRLAGGAKGRVVVAPQYREALIDLERFSHIILLYHFHMATARLLRVKPFHDDAFHGVLATRTVERPNPIGISVVRLEAIVDTTLHVVNVDIVDGTPLLDIKPFIPTMDSQYGANLGWLADRYNLTAAESI